MNEITCKVCGNKFTPFKSKRYEVVIPTTSFGIYSGQPMIGEAFDCPMCGCQHIVNHRYKTVAEAQKCTEKSICHSCREYKSEGEACDHCGAINNYMYFNPAWKDEGE